LFIFNTDLLLINVDFAHGVLIFVISTIAMLIFAAATQGYFFAKSRWYESILLLLVAFTFFRPGFWMDRMVAPYDDVAPQEIVNVAGEVPAGTELRMRILGEDDVGNPREFVAVLVLGEGVTGAEKLTSSGLEIVDVDGKTVVDNVGFGSEAQKAGLAFDQQILTLRVPSDQPSKQWLWIPAFLVLVLIVMLQRARRGRGPELAAPAVA
jgi:hypothetical protein